MKKEDIVSESGTESLQKDDKISKLSKEVRGTIFEVLFILLKEEESSVWQLMLMRMIDFFQLMVFPFSEDAQFPWKATGLFSSLQSIVEVFQVISYLSSFPWTSYLVIFYLGILLVVLVIIDIIYVLYSIARKNFAFIWPLKALTMFCSIFVTMLFLPLLKLFVSMFSCKSSSDGTYVHAYYPEVQCWQGLHILHTIMAIAVSLVFILITLIVTLTFYDTKTVNGNAGSRVNSRTDVFLVLYKIVCIILFAFFSDIDYGWILVVVLNFGSIYNYYKCKVERPYYNDTISKLWDMTNAVYLWINITLLIQMILQDTSYSGGIQLIGLGIPLSAIVEYFSSHPKHFYLSKQIDFFSTPEECKKFLRFLTLVVYTRNEKLHRILLESYTEKHSQYCWRPKCTITVYIKQLSDRRFKQIEGEIGLKLLLSHIKDCYKICLKKYKHSAGIYYVEILFNYY